MASITKQRIGKYTYLYESTSYRDEQGRPRNKKVKIGKIDPYTNETVYTTEYEQKTGMERAVPHKKKAPVLWNIKETLDQVKDYGVFWFLLQTAKNIGLLNILKRTFPVIWKEIFTLACYLIASDKPVMYCEDWLSENEWLDIGNMSSQRISDLFCSFGEADRNEFYRAWYQRIRESEYIALDITSISSYSQNRTECEYGYNRDGDDLPQTNLCMLFGEKSKLPIYQTNYSGSLGDVSTLECTTAKFKAMFGENDAMFVMDKGFYSKKNVDMLLDKGIKFLISVPFASKFTKRMIENERNDIDNLDNVIVTSGDPIRGVQRNLTWNNGSNLYTHMFFNPEKALRDRNELFMLITKLKSIVASGSEYGQYKAEIERYLIVEKSENDCRIDVRNDVVAKKLETSGWFLLISNHIDNPQQAFDAYRTKDVVEKSFWKYKHSLGIDRLRIHSDKRAENKTFVAFIALILSSYINNTMKDKQLYGRLTFDKLFLILAKLKSLHIGEHFILRPLTRQQRDLFEAFGVPLPVG